MTSKAVVCKPGRIGLGHETEASYVTGNNAEVDAIAARRMTD
jgi:hypothetical protein